MWTRFSRTTRIALIALGGAIILLLLAAQAVALPAGPDPPVAGPAPPAPENNDQTVLFQLRFPLLVYKAQIPTLFWKAGGWRDYAPGGVPDFDQHQDHWGVGAAPEAADWRWTYCGPVAVANSLWWFDSKFEPAPVPPPAINDGYPLVQSYMPGKWDDHDPRNVDNPGTPPGPNGEFVEDLAWRMDTDGQLSGVTQLGTDVVAMYKAILKYLADHGLAAQYQVTLMPRPGYDWVAEEVYRSEDVILLLGFWQLQPGGDWVRIGGHFVTVPGVNAQQGLIAFSDPARDNAETGGPGRVLPAPHMLPHSVTLHNDAAYVSHDVWRVVGTNSPGGIWGPAGYGDNLIFVRDFVGQNVPEELAEFAGPLGQGPIQTEVEYAIAVSPAEQHPTPTPSPTRLATATPTATTAATATRTPASTATPTPTSTSTLTPSWTRTPTPTATRTPTATVTRPPAPTATPTSTLTPTPTATPGFIWKAGGWIDYAPSGVPDFDQRQDNWGVGAGPAAPGWRWTYCGPVAVANSIWWFDSKFEPNPVPPPTINDGYPLVWSYRADKDDHDPLNVDDPNTLPGPNGEFVEDLAWRMDTDGRRTGAAHFGTNVVTMHQAILKYLADHGLASAYDVTLMPQPGYDWVVGEVRRSEDVILLLGFWEERITGEWVRIGGHFVTVPGVYPQQGQIAFSDPARDNAEAGGPGRVLPGPHMPPHPATLHNDAAFVSHDIWQIIATNSPGGAWGPAGYGDDLTFVLGFAEQNIPEEFQQQTGEYSGGPLQVEVEYAIAVSPKEGTPTPTSSPTPTATPSPTPTRTRTPTATWTRPSGVTNTPTATKTQGAPPTPADTSTPTGAPTPTATPTPTPTATRKPLLTGVSSTFVEISPGVIEITIHVVYDDLDRMIYDLEFIFSEQQPPWEDAEPLAAPEGWGPMEVPGGIGFVTATSPLVKCQPVKFRIQVFPPVVGDFIWIHLTGVNHDNLGYIVSQRVQPG